MIIHVRDLPEYRVPKPYERSLGVALDPRPGNYDRAAVILVTVEPGSTAGLHQHTSDEIIYVIAGKGVSVPASGDKVTGTEVSEGCLVLARAEVKHEMRNTSTEVLRLYRVFIPPLPAEEYLAEALRVAIRKS